MIDERRKAIDLADGSISRGAHNEKAVDGRPDCQDPESGVWVASGSINSVIHTEAVEVHEEEEKKQMTCAIALEAQLSWKVLRDLYI